MKIQWDLNEEIIGSTWRDDKIIIKRSRDLLEVIMILDGKIRSSWKENNYMKRAWDLEEEIMKSNRLCDLHEEIMIYTKRDQNIYTVRSWDKHEDNMRSKWMRSIQREHDMYMQRAWSLYEQSMRCKWIEHKIYIKRSWDVN